MIQTRIALLLLIVCSISHPGVIAQTTVQNTGNYILVVNSINFNETKNREIFNLISEEFTSAKMQVESEVLEIPVIRNMEGIEIIRKYLRTKYSVWKKPRIILFVGDPSWLLCKPLLDGIWKDVPAIISMARDSMLSDISDMINQSDTSIAEKLRPTKEIIKGYNTVSLQQPVYIKETLDVMYKLIPDMKRLLFISDQRYISAYTRICLRDVVKKSFPQLELTELTSPALSTEDLLDSLSQQKNNTGIIYSSWFVPVHRALDTYLDDNIKSLVQAFSQSPIFILTDIDPNGQNFAGGHYLHTKEMAHSCISLIYRILRGEQPRDMPIIQGGIPYAQLNYAQLYSKGIPDSQHPSNAVYVQVPLTFWNKYKWSIIITVLSLAIIITLLITLVYSYKLRNRTREQRIKMYQGYRRLINNMPILYGRFHFLKGASGEYEDYEFLRVNHAFEELFNIPCKEIEGKRYSEIIEHYPLLQQLHWSYLTSPKTQLISIPENTIFYLDKTICKVPNQNDVFDIFGQDNTLVHESLNKAKDYKIFLEGLFDNLPFSVVVRDAMDNLQPLYWNQKTEELFGLTSNSVINDPCLLEKNQIVKAISDMDREVVSSGKGISDVCKFEIEGDICYYAIQKRIVTRANQSKWLISTIWDVTAEQRNRRLLESLNERLQTVLKVARMAVWTYNIEAETMECDNKYVTESSQQFPEYVAFSKQEFLNLVHPDDRKHLVNSYQAFIEKQRPFLDEELRLTDGRLTDWVRVYGVVMQTNENGSPHSLIGAVLNINARKRTEQDLRQAKEAAETSDRLKSAFLANMSHEIRTPLNAIVGFSEALMMTDNPTEQQEYINIITNNNELLLRLIGDILDLAKIEAGMLEFVYTDVDINAAFKELEQSSRLRMHNSEVEIHFAEQMPELIMHTDRNRLMQVMNNLMTNAMKFTHQGHINFGYQMSDNGIVHFYLSDTGTGIPKEQQPYIFERFVKLNSFVQGTGLGLSICQSIVKRLNGEIGVDSEPGKGSTFWFDIPYVSPQETAVEVSAIPLPEKKILMDNEKPVILIAEDNPSNYHLYETVLKNDYTLLHAWNGEEAVRLFREHQPHLILMDIKMPVMDGYEATKKIRKLSTTIDIIAITAFAFSSDEVHILNSGFNGYIPKPIHARSLTTKVKEALKTSRML